MALLAVLGIGLAWLWISCGEPSREHAPRHPVPTKSATSARWTPVGPSLETETGASLDGYDGSCIARVEIVDLRQVVTMVACPDGRVGWFG